ncbi:MAG: MFS transporter [Actinobacteria bacterium]|nr:MFS transporter [Actinomycetota bacterium]
MINKNKSKNEEPERLYTVQFLFLNLINILALSHANFFVIFPNYLKMIGKNEWQIGIIMGAYSIGAIVIRPLVGELLDRKGRKFFIILGLVICAVSSLLYIPDIESTFYFLVIRFIHAIGLATYFTAVFTTVADITPSHRMTEGIGIFGISGLATIAIGPVFAEMIQVRFGYEGLFLAAFACTVISMILARLVIKESHFPHPRMELHGFFKVLGMPGIMAIVLGAVIFGVTTNSVSVYIAPFAKILNFPRVGEFFVYYAATAIIIRIFAGPSADKWGQEKVIIPGFLFIGTGLFLISGVHEYTLFNKLGIFMGIAHALIWPALNSLMVHRVPEGARGTGMSIFTGSVDLGNFLGAVSFGFLAHAAGYRTMYLTASLTAISGLMIFIMLNLIAKRKLLYLSEE